MFMNQSRKFLRAKGRDIVVNGKPSFAFTRLSLWRRRVANVNEKPSFAFTRLSLWRRRIAMAGKVVNGNLRAKTFAHLFV
jgi:hypothetical protein